MSSIPKLRRFILSCNGSQESKGPDSWIRAQVPDDSTPAYAGPVLVLCGVVLCLLCYCLPAEAVDHGRHNALVGFCCRIASVAMHIPRQCTEDPIEHHITMPGAQEHASAGDSWAFLNTEFGTFQNIYPIYACHTRPYKMCKASRLGALHFRQTP